MIKRQKEIYIINECSAIFDREELKQAILWKTNLPVLSTKRVFMYGNYPAISIYDKKIHIHRLLMEYWLNARIPKEFAVHHLNKNKLDARKENLAVVAEVLTDPAPIPVVEQLKEVGTEHLDILEEEKPKPKKKTRYGSASATPGAESSTNGWCLLAKGEENENN